MVSSPGLVARGDSEADIEMPPDGDSQPNRFAFTAGRVGLHPVQVEAYQGGTHLGTALLQLSVEQRRHCRRGARPARRAVVDRVRAG